MKKKGNLLDLQIRVRTLNQTWHTKASSKDRASSIKPSVYYELSSSFTRLRFCEISFITSLLVDIVSFIKLYYYHYRTVHNKETVTGEEILKSHVACLLTFKFPCNNFSFSRPRMTGNSAPSFERKYQ